MKDKYWKKGLIIEENANSFAFRANNKPYFMYHTKMKI